MPRCPICKNRSERRENNPYAPFCSQRCKLIDLGNWIGEGYRIPDDDASSDETRLNRSTAPRDGDRSTRRGRR